MKRPRNELTELAGYGLIGISFFGWPRRAFTATARRPPAWSRPRDPLVVSTRTQKCVAKVRALPVRRQKTLVALDLTDAFENDAGAAKIKPLEAPAEANSSGRRLVA